MSDDRRCPDCAVEPGQAHDDGCDVARCLATGGQRLMCDGQDEEPPYAVHDCGQDVWTGLWPGKAECEEFGWWAVFVPDVGYEPVPAGTPGAVHDLNRLWRGCGWDRVSGRWVRRAVGVDC